MMNLGLSFVVLGSVLGINMAIVTLPSDSLTAITESVKKEKRGVFGFGAHGHHHGYPSSHYDDFPPYGHHLNHHPHPHPHQHPSLSPVGPPPVLPPAPGPVNLGAHFHTTVTRKIGVPIPYPYPVKVPFPIYKPYPVPVDRPVPVPHYVPHPVVVNPPPLPQGPPLHHHHHHPWPPHKW